MNYIAYFVTICSIVGTVANSFQKRWCFWVWICTNTFWCIFNIILGSYAQALLYAFNFAMAVVGLIKWKKKKINNSLFVDRFIYSRVMSNLRKYCPNGNLEAHREKNGNIILLTHEEHRKIHESMEE